MWFMDTFQNSKGPTHPSCSVSSRASSLRQPFCRHFHSALSSSWKRPELDLESPARCLPNPQFDFVFSRPSFRRRGLLRLLRSEMSPDLALPGDLDWRRTFLWKDKVHKLYRFVACKSVAVDLSVVCVIKDKRIKVVVLKIPKRVN